MRIEELRFAGPATEAQQDFYRLATAWAREYPGRNGETTFEQFARRAGESGPDLPRRRYLLARAADGSAVGTADLVLPVKDNTRMVMTGTAADNVGMITVNERIGYRTIGAWTNYETDLGQVAARVRARARAKERHEHH